MKKRYSETHEWVVLKGDVATIGISAHAAHELGDITFVELPELKAKLHQGDQLGTVESVKAAAEVFAPVTGTVSEVNSKLVDEPEIISQHPEAEGWMVRIAGVSSAEVDALMSEEDYEEFLHQKS